MRLKTAALFWLGLLFLMPQTAPGQDVTRTDTGNQEVAVAKLKKQWPAFRGFQSKGRAFHANPPLTWSVKRGENILWKAPVAKHGMSSPVVVNQRVFLTGANEKSRDVYCFDATKGALLWQHAVSDLPGAPADGKLPRVLEETGFAAPTMTTDGRLIAAIFATGELVCLTMNGKRVWARHLGAPTNHYGHASSLISDRELLFVQWDQEEKSKLLAFTMATGEPAWSADRDGMSWSSPILINNAGRAELVLTDSKYVTSYRPKTGKPLWRVECLSGEVASSAAYADGLVFVASEGAAASAIDIADHDRKPKIIWQWEESLPDAASPAANKDFLVVPTAFGVVTCLAARTGRVHWEHEFDRGFNSSPIVVDKRVFITDMAGGTHVFKLGGKFESLGHGDVGEPVYATPAFVGNRIYLRGLNHIFCVGEKPQPQP